MSGLNLEGPFRFVGYQSSFHTAWPFSCDLFTLTLGKIIRAAELKRDIILQNCATAADDNDVKGLNNCHVKSTFWVVNEYKSSCSCHQKKNSWLCSQITDNSHNFEVAENYVYLGTVVNTKIMSVKSPLGEQNSKSVRRSSSFYKVQNPGCCLLPMCRLVLFTLASTNTTNDRMIVLCGDIAVAPTGAKQRKEGMTAAPSHTNKYY